MGAFEKKFLIFAPGKTRARDFQHAQFFFLFLGNLLRHEEGQG
jgi:hypothetical protein